MNTEEGDVQIQIDRSLVPHRRALEEKSREEDGVNVSDTTALEASVAQVAREILNAMQIYQSRCQLPPPAPAVVSHAPESLLSKAALKVYNRLPEYQYDEVTEGTSAYPAELLSDGSIYIGERREGLPWGKGKLYGKDGSFSEGYWKQGKIDSVGRVIETNGDFYEGGFRDGKKSGSGTFESASGAWTYSGEWEDNRPHGLGCENANGSRYEGPFVNGAKTGKGKLLTADGGEYVGEVVNGLMEGTGTYLWTDGKRFTGTWKSGKMHGLGYFTSEKGVTKRFEFAEGVRGREVPEGTK